jgi:histidinol phosphatase-like enzyme
MGSSILIGDKVTDIQAGAAAGVGTLLILNSDEVPDNSQKISDLKEAAQYLFPPFQT